MLICFLRGGLGNQIIQYLVASHYATKLNKKILFTGFLMLKHVQICLGWSVRSFHFPQLVSFKSSIYSAIFFILSLLSRILQYSESIIVDGCSFQLLPFSNHIILKGYIQNVKILDSISLDLWRNAFHMLNNVKLNYFANNNSVSVHVRKGDYLSYSEIFHALEPSYFINSINFILDNSNDIREITIFTDDLPWTFESLLPDLLPCIQSRGILLKIDASNEVDAFCLMCRSNYLVMSNSTFSLCSAYIMRALGCTGYIVQPNFWFKNEKNQFLNSSVLQSF